MGENERAVIKRTIELAVESAADQKLLANPDLQESLAQMRRGEGTKVADRLGQPWGEAAKAELKRLVDSGELPNRSRQAMLDALVDDGTEDTMSWTRAQRHEAIRAEVVQEERAAALEDLLERAIRDRDEALDDAEAARRILADYRVCDAQDGMHVEIIKQQLGQPTYVRIERHGIVIAMGYLNTDYERA
jgi:hypothetical protein